MNIESITKVGKSALFLYEGILFKADMNDVAAAYEDVKRVASDPMNKGIVTRKDFLDSVWFKESMNGVKHEEDK